MLVEIDSNLLVICVQSCNYFFTYAKSDEDREYIMRKMVEGARRLQRIKDGDEAKPVGMHVFILVAFDSVLLSN